MSQLLMEKIAAYSEEKEEQMYKEHESKMKRKGIVGGAVNGGTLGAFVGLGAGNIRDFVVENRFHPHRNAMLGALIGGGVGATSGALMGRHHGKAVAKDDRSYRKSQLQKYKALQGIDASDFEDLKYLDDPWAQTGKTPSRAQTIIVQR